MPITENLATDTGVVGDLITADPTLTGSAKPNVLLTLTEGGQVLGTATADGSGIWSFRPVGLADGAHTIVVGNDLNVAIQGTGFFQIQLPDGEIAYTRDGGFTLSATGQLVTANGNVVLPGITIPNGALAVTIDDTGTVQVLLAGQSAPIQVGNLQIATFANEAGLVPLGGGLFQTSANSGAPITGSPGSPGFGTISQAETASLSFTLDTSAPQPANHLANDTGVSQTDAVTSDATLTGVAAPN
jgi:flagellar hook protein FlgE/Big-like domain-containing protein